MITSPSIWGALKDEAQNNVYRFVGSGAPVNGASGTGVGIGGLGTTYLDTVTGNSYKNIGTITSPVWSLVSGVGLLQYASGTISSANITGTSAGQFGHAQGVSLVPAPGAGLALQLESVGLYSVFGVAAYGAGGNITVNWGAGGAALTGLVSAANTLGNAASKAWMFTQLSTAALAIVSNAALNLVSSAAFTQPGTAAGVINWECWYRVMSVGF